MISLDQVLLLEQRVESAVKKIEQLQSENDALRRKCAELTNALSTKSEQLSTFETDQNQIEDGIRKALDRLNSIEDAVFRTASSIQNKQNSADHFQPIQSSYIEQTVKTGLNPQQNIPTEKIVQKSGQVHSTQPTTQNSVLKNQNDNQKKVPSQALHQNVNFETMNSLETQITNQNGTSSNVAKNESFSNMQEAENTKKEKNTENVVQNFTADDNISNFDDSENSSFEDFGDELFGPDADAEEINSERQFHSDKKNLNDEISGNAEDFNETQDGISDDSDDALDFDIF